MDKEDVEYYSAMKKEKLPCIGTWLDFKGIMLSEISQTERDKQMLYDITYTWNLRSAAK